MTGPCLSEDEERDGDVNHRYPRTERDLRAIAVSFSAGRIVRGLPERLECLAAWHRTVIEAEKAGNNEPNNYDVAHRDYAVSVGRLRLAGVAQSVGEFTLSPCMGPDEG